MPDSLTLDQFQQQYSGPPGQPTERTVPVDQDHASVPLDRINESFSALPPEHKDEPPKKKEKVTEPMKMAIDTMNTLHAAAHGVSPSVNAPDKKLLGEAYETDDPGRWQYKDEEGSFKDADPKHHVILTDPEDNKNKVYQKMEEGNPVWDRLVALGRVAQLATVPSARAITVAPKTAELVHAATQEGITIPSHAVAQPGLVKNVITPVSQKIPGGTTAAENAAARTAGEMSTAAGNAAETTAGRISNAEEAGNATRGAVEQYTAPQKEGGVLMGRAEKFYDRVRDAIPGTAKAEMPATLAAAQKIVDEVEASGRPGLAKVNEVLGAVTKPGGVTYEGMHRLRSDLREMLRNGKIPEGMGTGDTKRLISALGEDINGLAKSAGGDKAVNALAKADKHYALASDRIDKLQKVLGPESRSDEGIFNAVTRMASSGSAADAKTLALARKAIPAEEWEHVASAAAANLGRKDGVFDPARFARQYGSLSEKGKNLLFGEGSETRTSLDNIKKVADHWDKIVGPTGHSEITHAIAVGAGMHGIEESGSLFKFLGAVIGNRALSNALSRPATLKSISNFTQRMEIAAGRPTQGNFQLLSRAAQQADQQMGQEYDSPAHISEFVHKFQRALETGAKMLPGAAAITGDSPTK